MPNDPAWTGGETVNGVTYVAFGELSGMDFYKKIAVMVHCKEKIGDVWIVSEQLRIICRSIGIRIAQFVGY